MMAAIKERVEKRVKKGKKTDVTTRHIRSILPSVLAGISRVYNDRPDLVMAAWPSIVGAQVAKMTRVVSFVEGILTVQVSNSTLYSLLSVNDKPRLIKNLRDRFPGTSIKTIHFRLA